MGMMESYGKALIVCPNFEGEYINFENFFKKKGFIVKSIVFEEGDFAIRRKGLLKFLSKVLRVFLSSEMKKNLGFDRHSFDNFLVEHSKDFIDSRTIVFFVKPFLLQENNFMEMVNQRTDGLIFYSYDSYRRFPLAKEVCKGHVITFDIKDALKYGFKYAAVPRESDGINNIFKPRVNALYHYGAFSYFRLVRLIIVNIIFRLNGLSFTGYLMHGKFSSNFKLMNIYIGGEKRNILTNRICIDIPQKPQSGGSFRSKNTRDMLFSYAISTPRWRYINGGRLYFFICDVLFIAKVVKSKNVYGLYLDEFGLTSVSLDQTIKSILGNRYILN